MTDGRVDLDARMPDFRGDAGHVNGPGTADPASVAKFQEAVSRTDARTQGASADTPAAEAAVLEEESGMRDPGGRTQLDRFPRTAAALVLDTAAASEADPAVDTAARLSQNAAPGVSGNSAMETATEGVQGSRMQGEGVAVKLADGSLWAEAAPGKVPTEVGSGKIPAEVGSDKIPAEVASDKMPTEATASKVQGEVAQGGLVQARVAGGSVGTPQVPVTNIAAYRAGAYPNAAKVQAGGGAGASRMAEAPDAVLTGATARTLEAPPVGVAVGLIPGQEESAAAVAAILARSAETALVNPGGAALAAPEKAQERAQERAPDYLSGAPLQTIVQTPVPLGGLAAPAMMYGSADISNWADMVSRVMVHDHASGERGVMMELDGAPLKGVMVSVFEESGMWVVQCECPQDPPHKVLSDNAAALAAELAPRLERTVLLRVMRSDPDQRDMVESLGSIGQVQPPQAQAV